jgi:ribosome recycling factor
MKQPKHREIINQIKPEMEKAISFLERELAQIKTGRPSPALVEKIEVDYYGKKLFLRELASISVEGSRQLLIQPWDKEIILNIERAILGSGLGLNPVVEGGAIRISFPPLSEEFRKELLKILNEKLEACRFTIRRWREEAWRKIQKGFREGEIREDDKYRAKDELQDLIDQYNEKINQLGEQKKKEILE